MEHMADESFKIFHLEIPLQSPFSTATGTIESRSIVLVRVGPEPYGWGEAAPFPGQDEPIEEVIEAAKAGEWTPTLSAAVDQATADRDARVAGVWLGDEIGAAMSQVPISLAVGLDDPMRGVMQAVDQGVSRFKLKIAPGRVGHVARIRRRFPDAVIGVDANGSFGSDTIGEIAVLSDVGVAYIEQPVVNLASMAVERLHEMVEFPVFADESVRSVADAERVLSLQPVDGVVVKPGRLGWFGALAVRDLANAAGKLWRASGLLETGVGRAYTDILAACPDAFISDVAPAEWFLETDVTGSRYRDGYVMVPSGPGLGINPTTLA